MLDSVAKGDQLVERARRVPPSQVLGVGADRRRSALGVSRSTSASSAAASYRAVFTRARRQLKADTSHPAARAPNAFASTSVVPEPRTGPRRGRPRPRSGGGTSRRAAARTCRGTGAGDGRASSARAREVSLRPRQLEVELGVEGRLAAHAGDVRHGLPRPCRRYDAAHACDPSMHFSGVPLFTGLEKKELDRLAHQMRERVFAEGATVVVEGETGAGFFVIGERQRDGQRRRRGQGDARAGRSFRRGRADRRGPPLGVDHGGHRPRCYGLTPWEFARSSRSIPPSPGRSCKRWHGVCAPHTAENPCQNDRLVRSF